MAFSKLYIENRLPFAVHLVLDAKHGELSITAHRRVPRGTGGVDAAKTDRVEPGKAAVYGVNVLLRSCIRGTKLNYVFRNRTGIPLVFSAGRTRMADGPIFEIADGRN